MTAINGLPGHVLLVHFLVVLVPLTALLEIVCAVWPAVPGEWPSTPCAYRPGGAGVNQSGTSTWCPRH